jgi:hypothetical protein
VIERERERESAKKLEKVNLFDCSVEQRYKQPHDPQRSSDVWE